MKKPVVILSCEHAVNTIPPEFSHYFTRHQDLLNTHRGIDFGAQAIAQSLSKSLDCYLLNATISRLLIDFNRSINQTGCFSEISNTFPEEKKKELIAHYYQPFRQQILQQIQTNIDKGYQVWHLSIHSFTPILNGVVRETEFGLLYDPARASEKDIALSWQKLLKSHCKEWRTRLNYPYKGTADGFTTSLRTQFPDSDYVGIEVESNQALTQESSSLAKIINSLEITLKALLQRH